MPTATTKIQEYFVRELTRGWLDLVTAERVTQLVQWLTTHKVTKTKVTANGTSSRQRVDAYEKKELRELLSNEEWRRALSDDGVHALETFLGIRNNAANSGHGRDAPGTVPVGSIPGNLSTRIGRVRDLKVEHFTALFNEEYNARKGLLFEKASLSAEERGKNVLYLLQDYAKALNALGDSPEVARQRRDLLAAFFDKPAARLYGAADPDDDLLSTAWEIVWGTDPERAQSRFTVNEEAGWSAYMSMNGEFVETARKIDDYLRAKGSPAKAEAFEKKSPLNWIVGREPGNTKPGWTFEETRAISSTGVDFAVELLGDTRGVGKRTLEPSFDLKVDFFAWNEFVPLDKASGDRLVAIRDSDKAELKVQVGKVGENQWRPLFKDKRGRDVPATEVTVVVKDRRGEVKGDGEATGSYSASWWGFCDRNAMQGLVTLKYGFPKPQKGVTLKINRKEIAFSQDDVIHIVGRRLTEIFPKQTQAGSRNDGEPDQVHLNGGKVLHGRITSEVDFYRPNTYRSGDDMVMVPEGPDAPRGTLLIKESGGETREIAADTVKEIRRKASSSRARATQDTIVMKDGTRVSGTLESKVSFAHARTRNGSLVLAHSDTTPILGDIQMTTVRGEEKRIAVSDISYMVREDENEILADEALAYIIRNQGIFAADSSTGSMVANGQRTIDAIRRWKAGAPDKPDWVPEDLASLTGYRGKVQDASKLAFFSLDYKDSMWGGLKFWFEVDDNNTPVNCGIISGQWDFLWGVEGEPDWKAKATFNPHVPNDLVLTLYIRSLTHPERYEKVLPRNWRTYLNG